MRFYGDKEKRDGIRDSMTHKLYSWTLTWDDILLFENEKEDSLGLNSVTRLVELLKKPLPGYIKEMAFDCISSTENFLGCGGALYHGEITTDESCYDNLTDQSSDEDVESVLDKAVQYNWNLQKIHLNIDKDEWVGFWRRYNLLQFFSNTCYVVENTVQRIDRDEVKMYYPGLEKIVDALLDNNIVFGLDGDSDLTDSDGIVLASAGMLIRESKVAIDPIDDNSTMMFESAGYTIVYSNNFNIDDIKKL